MEGPPLPCVGRRGCAIIGPCTALADGPLTTVLLGGYWGPRIGSPSQFFGDGFESGDLSEWTASFGGLP